MNFTDIFEAAKKGMVEDVRYFIEQNGVDVNTKNDSDFTPLHLATTNGNFEVVKFLISKGANIKAKAGFGSTPLHHAISFGDTNIAKFLISAGADVNEKDYFGSPLYVAVTTSKIELADKIEIAKALISAGADVNAKSNDNSSLYAAASDGQTEIAEVLISLGADVNARNNNGFTPLHAAALKGNVEMAKALISAGANVNAKEYKYNLAPLHGAASSGNVEIAKVLISAGADINAATNEGLTPLDFAKNNGNMAMVQYLSSIRYTASPRVAPSTSQYKPGYAQTEKTNEKSKTKIIIIALVILGILFWFFSGNGKTEQLKETIPPEKEKPKMNTFIDSRDNKTYKIVKIGSQTWMAENLNIIVDGSKCYDDNPANCNKYGRLYTWAAAKKACPAGWHLPSDAEWTKLANFVGEETAGIKLRVKENNGADEYEFAALPGGNSYKEKTFEWLGVNGYWWTDSELDAKSAYYRAMGYEIENVRSNSNYKTYFFSVRCIHDVAAK